ncbi:MAG: hypothetical protein ACJARX_002486, partial [Psychroserpens sp.]
MEQDTREDYDHGESGRVSFDFRGYLFKILNLWKLVLLSIGFSLAVAYYINVRKQNVYKLDSLISVESEQNPFFTANTSISFNWGGVSGKVGKVITAIRTRTHNEKVVDSLQSYMEYLVEGTYRKEDIYKKAPFDFSMDKSQPQVLGYPVGIRILNATEFEVFTEFESARQAAQTYGNHSVQQVTVATGLFKKTFKTGAVIDLPFLNGRLVFKPSMAVKPGAEYYINFLNFDAIVNRYQNSIIIGPAPQAASSILRLQLAGTNKAKIVDYLNATSAILSRSELERKNLYATNTIKFIDSSLAAVNMNLKDFSDEMNTFRRQNKVFDVSEEITQISEQLRSYDLTKEQENAKLSYLDNLE